VLKRTDVDELVDLIEALDAFARSVDFTGVYLNG
jgi:hypothetical protein